MASEKREEAAALRQVEIVSEHGPEVVVGGGGVERVDAAAGALGDERQAEVRVGPSVDQLHVGVDLQGRAGEL